MKQSRDYVSANGVSVVQNSVLIKLHSHCLFLANSTVVLSLNSRKLKVLPAAQTSALMR